MDKGIGFNRNIYLSWLDAVAAFCTETHDPVEIRARLEPVVGQTIRSTINRRKAIDILINVWVKSAEIAPALRDEAAAYFQATSVTSDRLWLHYGLTLIRYPFFREVAEGIGQLGRYEEAITPAMVKARLVAGRGQLGSLGKAAERVLFSLRDWDILTKSDQRYAYIAIRQALTGSDSDIELWLLACALRSHPAAELPFADLVRLPELFPFRFTVGVEDLRRSPRFEVQRQGAGWDVVRLRVKGSADDTRE